MSMPKPVLVVEDDPDDVMFLKEALKPGSDMIALHAVPDGDEALAYLRKKGAYAAAHRPAIILLDLKLPKKDGWEVLREVKGDPALKCIPVIVLTTSSSALDIDRAYSLGANCYLAKPTGMDALSDLAVSLLKFWIILARLPSDLGLSQ